MSNTDNYPPMSREKEDPGTSQPSLEWKPRKQEYLIMATMAMCSLVVALDTTILVSVLPTLATDLHGTSNEAFWCGSSYLLANAVFQPFIAALSDIFGRRELLVPGILLFILGSALCGSANHFTQLLAGRVVQGIGGGGMITLAQLIFADLIPLRQRPKFYSIVLLAWAVGTVLGPFLGGVFVQRVSWRWCFYINLPICGVALIMTIIFVDPTTEKVSIAVKLAQVDWIGGFLFISSLTSFLIAICWGGIQFAWDSWHTLVPLLVGATGIVASLLWERYGTKHPFLLRSLFTSWSAIAAYIGALAQGLILLMGCYYSAFYFSSVKLANPITSGVNLFPTTVFMLPGSAIVSALITRLGSFRWAIWVGWTISTIGCGLLINWDLNTSKAVWAVSLSVFGIGTGMVLSSLNFGIQAIVSAEDAGRGASMYTFIRSLGMTLGVALGGTIFQNMMKSKLTKLNLPATIAENAEAYLMTIHTLDPDQQATVLSAYVHGFKGVFEVMTAMSGFALVLSLIIKHHNMDKLLASKYRLSGRDETTTSPDATT